MASKIKFKRAIFPGSFAPFHEGHYSILLKANALFDEVIILVANNPYKPSIPLETRKKQVQEYLKIKGLNNLVITTAGYTTEIALLQNCNYLVRGLRDHDDFSFEQNLYKENKILQPQIETIYFMADEDYVTIHSNKK